MDVPPVRLWGYSVLEGDEVLAFGGLAFMPDHVVAFVQGHEHISRFPLAFHKAVRRGLEEARNRGITRIIAMADEQVPAAERWLERLGFVLRGDVWVWEV